MLHAESSNAHINNVVPVAVHRNIELPVMVENNNQLPVMVAKNNQLPVMVDKNNPSNSEVVRSIRGRPYNTHFDS